MIWIIADSNTNIELARGTGTLPDTIAFDDLDTTELMVHIEDEQMFLKRLGCNKYPVRYIGIESAKEYDQAVLNWGNNVSNIGWIDFISSTDICFIGNRTYWFYCETLEALYKVENVILSNFRDSLISRKHKKFDFFLNHAGTEVSTIIYDGGEHDFDTYIYKNNDHLKEMTRAVKKRLVTSITLRGDDNKLVNLYTWAQYDDIVVTADGRFLGSGNTMVLTPDNISRLVESE